MLSRSELNQQRTIADIESAFLSLYKGKGIENVSVSTICQKCKMSRSTFYAYFDDKYNVLEEVENRLLTDLWEINRRLPDISDQKYIGESAGATANYIRDNIDWFQALLSETGDPHFLYRWKKDIIASFVLKIKNLNLSDDEKNIRAEMYAMSLIGIYQYLFFNKKNFNTIDFSKYLGYLLGRFL